LDALAHDNVVVATLSNLYDHESHAVLIYSFKNYKFKVKDPYGKKYEIPIDRPDFIQGKIMQMIKLVTKESRWILDQIYPGKADFLMQQAPQDRMEAVATYLAEQIKNEKNSQIAKLGYLRPDCSTINLAETSDQPEAWLFHPTGITFKFDVKKL